VPPHGILLPVNQAWKGPRSGDQTWRRLKFSLLASGQAIYGIADQLKSSTTIKANRMLC
jgi:hypothetical protein